MKKTLLILFFLGFFICHPVFADSWIDEGNYNPDWKSKCNNICIFDDEKDLAGVYKMLVDNPNSTFGSEVIFEKTDLDFSVHDLPILSAGRISLHLGAASNHTIKVRYLQMFGISGSQPREITYVYRTFVPSIEHGTVTILENEYGERGDKVRFQVLTDEGYTATVRYKKVDSDYTFYYDATNIGNHQYEIPYTSDESEKYNIYLNITVRPTELNVFQHLDEGVSCNQCSVAQYGVPKEILYFTSADHEISSVTVNGTPTQLVNGNKLVITTTSDVTVVVHTTKRMRDTIKKIGNVSINFNIDKKRPDQTFLPGVVFNLRNLEDNFRIPSLVDSDVYFIQFPFSPSSLETFKRRDANPIIEHSFLDGYQMLPENYQRMLDSISTYGDISLFENQGFNIHQSITKGGNVLVEINTVFPMILEETSVPIGFSKKKYIVSIPIKITMEFYVEQNHEISSDSPLVETVLNINEKLYSFYEYKESLLQGIFSNTILGQDSYYVCVPIPDIDCSHMNLGKSQCTVPIVNEYGNPQLLIRNTVNHKNSIVVNRTDPLQYQIIVQNIGNAASTSNVIVTKLPKEVIYVEGSASDNGVYNKNQHSITWNKSMLDEEEEYTFTYQGKISDQAKSGVSFIGSSEISSNEVDIVQSGETQVQIQLLNPGTFRNVFSVFLLIFTVGMTSFTYYKKRSA